MNAFAAPGKLYINKNSISKKENNLKNPFFGNEVCKFFRILYSRTNKTFI